MNEKASLVRRFGIFVVVMFGLMSYDYNAHALTTFTINGPSGGDDRPQIQNAINSAIAIGNAEVVLRGGTYQLQTSDSGYGAHLVFAYGNNVTLRGYAGETVNLIYWNVAARGILAIMTRDLKVDSLNFDWKYHPFGQGTVHSIDTTNKVIWVTNDSGYPTWDNSIFYLPSQTTYLLRPLRGNTPPNCTILPQAVQGPWGFINGYDYFMYSDLNGCPDGIQPGQKVVLNRNSWTTVGIHLLKVHGAMLSNLTFYASPGLVTLNELTDAGTIYPKINFINYKILYNPTDSTRTITANSNGIFSTGSRAPIYVYNSAFYGQADDAIDVHGQAAYYVNLSQGGGQWTLAYNGNLDDFRSGDTVEIYNVQQGTVRCSVQTTGVPYACAPNYCVHVNVPNCSGMVSYNGSNGPTCNNCTWADWITITNQTVGATVDTNNFYGSRGRGIINETWNATITNNDIGDYTFGKPNWGGIYEGYCLSDGVFGPQARYTYPGHDSQIVSNNGGVYGNTVNGCWPNPSQFH